MPIEQMNVSLPPRMAKFIRGKVKSGQYTNASEVVRDAVRHMQEAEATRKSKHGDGLDAPLLPGEKESIRARVQAGIAAMDRGDYIAYDGKEGLEQLRAKMIATVKRAARSGKSG
ncbi:MAG: type II toxin-antitoxin system ParD family antitoxin [Bryobacterales bacterium]|nr:type II toxin-antitoxin system ParD family antitoxin [Bryobacterales bacterium]